MSEENNKALVKSFYAAIEREDWAALEDMVHEDFVFYNQVDTPHPGLQGLIDSEQKNFEAFESFSFPVEAMVAEGDTVAAYMHFVGKGYKTDAFGVPPSGKDCHISLAMWLTIKDGKIKEKRAHFDVADVRRQVAI